MSYKTHDTYSMETRHIPFNILSCRRAASALSSGFTLPPNRNGTIGALDERDAFQKDL